MEKIINNKKMDTVNYYHNHCRTLIKKINSSIVPREGELVFFKDEKTKKRIGMRVNHVLYDIENDGEVMVLLDKVEI